MTQSSFGAWLRQERKRRDLTQAALADRAGCAVITLQKIEADALRPSRQLAERLAGTLDLPPDVYGAFVAAARAPIAPEAEAEAATALGDPPDALIGRDDDLTAIAAILADPTCRLLTISGPGGVGKTRLALRLAADRQAHDPAGAAVVPLAAITDPALLPQAIAQRLSLAPTPGADPLADLAAQLRGRRLLLALDNIEQIRDAGPLLLDLLARCPQLTLLITSRVILRLRGERVYRLAPLALPPAGLLCGWASPGTAVELFVRRAQAIDQSFALDAHTGPAVAAICARLDGLPLAIELAAAAMRLLSPAALLERLDRPLRAFAGGPRDLPRRQQTLRATLDWSYALLRPAAQQLLRRLAVYAGGVSLETPGLAALGPEEYLLDRLAELLDSSLLYRRDVEGGRRFDLLETVRAYGLDQLGATGELAQAYEQLLDDLRAFAEAAVAGLRGADPAPWRALVAAEHTTVRGALRWALANDQGERALRLCAAIWPAWHQAGLWHEGRHWLDRALAAAPGAADDLRASGLNGAGVMALNLADYAGARQRLEEGIARFRAGANQPGLAAALGNLGLVLRRTGDYRRAVTLYQESLGIRRDLGDDWGCAAMLNNLGSAALQLGDLRQAEESLAQALALRTALGDTTGRGAVLSNLGLLHEQAGDLGRASAHYAESLAIARAGGDRVSSAIATLNLGSVAERRGDLPGALRCYHEGLRILWAIGDREGCADGLERAARVLAAGGHRRDAALLWGYAAHTRAAIGAPMPPAERGRHALAVANAAAHEGDWAALWARGAELSFEQALELVAAGRVQVEGLL